MPKSSFVYSLYFVSVLLLSAFVIHQPKAAAALKASNLAFNLRTQIAVALVRAFFGKLLLRNDEGDKNSRPSMLARTGTKREGDRLLAGRSFPS